MDKGLDSRKAWSRLEWKKRDVVVNGHGIAYIVIVFCIQYFGKVLGVYVRFQNVN